MKLVKYDAALRALAEAKRVDEVKAIRDKTKAVIAYAKQIKDREMLGMGIDIRMRAEDRAGAILIAMLASGERLNRGGDRRSKRPTDALKLTDIDTSTSQASRWQRFHRLPKAVKEDKIRRAKLKAISLLESIAKRTRVEMRADDERRVRSLKPVQGKYKTLVIDPPWDYEWLSVAGRASPGYATMTHEDLLDLDVSQWAENNCHMYLWVTNNFMTRGVELMQMWGFQHKTVLTWRKLSKTGKPWWGLGSYFRNATEHVLFGVRGELRTRSDSISTYFEAPIRDHSEKPEEFYDIVRKASYLPAAELFQRIEREGFVNVFVEPELKAAE